MSKIFCIVDGIFHPADEPAIPAANGCLMAGDGLFETIKVLYGKPVWLEEHLLRMEKSARFAGINFDQSDSCTKLCEKLISKNEIVEGFLRITLSRKTYAMGRASADMMYKKVLVVITGANFLSDEKPYKAAFATWPINESDPAVGHKTTSRFSLALESRKLERAGIDEILFLNTKDELAESTRSNLFWVKDKKLFTPAKRCGLLPGIIRAKVIENVGNIGVEMETGRFFKTALMDADEVFLTNSLIGIRPCIEVEGIRFEAGEITKKIRENFVYL
ncbi:MAG: 4-amino-4-deoxychorismate lyase [bacterium]|nr:MAG: 4-amino-4-deoxychorismate lyase [bacterium]